ncbi:2-oxoglutarate-dependent dioxygenase 19-like [Argentina anserina]|uniref:2-oxoglutarate-dependent dioxygenase 19-like n=1 Tax=Argentina anserina TaxID=57926 RepID=UPI002176444E|nr:2-oxoglutarate-dependent dioxygenase 19-like [Potentilla anserina]
MAPATDPVVTQKPSTIVSPNSITIKKLAESSQVTFVPSNYTYTDTPQYEAVLIDNEAKVPIVDFSLLTSSSPELRSKAISDLGKACEDWGFFLVINHGVPEELMKAVMDGTLRFFDLSEEEKHEYEGKHVLDPIRCGTSFNASVDKVLFWRDFLKVLVHPEFHFPDKPTGFSELSSEYCKRTREVTWELLKGISESLGLEADYLDTALNVKTEGLQIFIANLYPPCPQPELALGMPPHSDHGLLTLLIQNGIGGLQVQHNGKWVNVDAVPNSYLVNTGDHLEIFSNGKYKSNIHRATLNNKATRVSIAVPTGPSLDVVVTPASKLVENGHHPPAYVGMKYKDYLELQQSNMLDGKAILDRVRM